jgi:hypothetical protein
VAWIAAGSEQVTALGTDPAGTALAVASGGRIAVWPLLPARPAVVQVPGYDPDQAGEEETGTESRPLRDLLDADRDARALASLIASERLKGPIAIGLFGAWGSGKSFVLGRIRRMLGEITAAGHADGYLNEIRVVRFNAWQYAEVNLWASLVDEVLTEMGPVQPAEPPQQVQEAEEAARKAETTAQQKAAEVTTAQQDRDRLTRHRRLAWAAVAGAGVAAAAVIVVFVLGASARLAAGYGSAIALLTVASAAAVQVKRVAAEGKAVKETIQETGAAGAWLAGQMGSGAVDTARQKVATSRHDFEIARQQAERLRHEASQARELSVSPQLGSVLQRMSALTEYRDQLSLVARTRDRFEEIDTAVAAARTRRAQDPQRKAPHPEPDFERVVVMIDDLDRCPAEKVVTVLEAVHLLFDFEMFVVVIAVDTRWLDQSLRIRYRQLLGESGAVPSDYLEKIIQIPLQLTPLDAGLVRSMISGLIGGAGGTETGAAPAVPGRGGAGEPPGPSERAGPAPQRRAVKPRPPRAPLPAEVLRIIPGEASAMAGVAPLIGSTPRTVKRYVNTYRLLKARAWDLPAFDEPADGIADHQIVAFLLAIVTGQPELAAVLLPELTTPRPGVSLASVLTGLTLPDNAHALAGAHTRVCGWLSTNTVLADAPAARFTRWAGEIARFSFIPAVAFPDRPPAGPA